MGTGGRVGSKKSSKGHVSKRYVNSDDSDEDYMLKEDELDDETDELESVAGDASDEEILRDEEEEDEIRKVVRSTPQRRLVGQKKKETNRSSKRREIIAYGEEENNVSGDQDISDEEILPSSNRRNMKKGDSDDDEFNPDDHVILDEVEELLSQKRKKKQKSDMDDDDFNPDDRDFFDEEELSSPESKDKKKCDTDDDEFNPDDIALSEEEEDLPSPKGKRKKKNDTDDDEFNSDDLEILDDEENLPYSKGRYKKQSDTDDDEFYPDDLDLFDEEEDSPCSNKRRWKNFVKKRKRSSKSTKSKKLKNKVASSKRLPKRRKKNAILSSDSDCNSTEHEFTISEEEREQVREANVIFQRETSNLRCVTKSDQEDEVYKKPKKLTRRKGKEKVEEVKGEVGKQVCGICLTKEGKNTVRGTLNCCNHFFCCACIVEWSKVESRCPVCKQRFTTISKSAESAIRIDLRDVVIPVPERDQVYQPSEEELRGYLDPYEDVICTECEEGGDDALMLLCDLCDSPAHTYCVGLGLEVPDGNWYCEGCRPSENHPSERPDNGNPSINEPLPFENMAAEIDLNTTVAETPRNGGSTLSGRRMAHRLRFLLSSNRSDQSDLDADRFQEGSGRQNQFPSVGLMQFGQVAGCETAAVTHQS